MLPPMAMPGLMFSRPLLDEYSQRRALLSLKMSGAEFVRHGRDAGELGTES